ncbi:MAG: dynamin family protein [Cyanobacteria bacterium J06623_7]
MSDYSQLSTILRRLLGATEIAADSALYRDVTAVCDYLENPVYRLAIFAPFNHGKSTLLNALLGSKTLPIDLIPTTGAGIIIGYGAGLRTEITLTDGRKIAEMGSKILGQYAVLDDDRQMNRNVAAVKVFSPHPWLKTGVELLDLPGTNDREAQNELVKDLLLGADLILHVLDARKLMTLEEKEHLTHWLQNRGITRVVFVVNFLNLLTPAERQLVRERVRYVASSFRSDLPPGISNVYCVDALPALRARLKGDAPATQATGLTTLEAALQQIASRQNSQSKLPRVIKMSQVIRNRAIAKQQELQSAIQSRETELTQQIAVKQKASQLIQQGFEGSTSDLRGWLYLPQLESNYQAQIAIALARGSFDAWLSQFRQDVLVQQQSINRWIERVGEFFGLDSLQLLAINFPPAPVLRLTDSKQPPRATSESKELNSSGVPAELNKLLQGKIGTVVLGGASYILNRVAPKQISDETQSPTTKISSQIYADAATAYLKAFSDRANAQLTQYEQLARQYISYTPQPLTQQRKTEDYQLQLLTNLLDELETELNRG